MPPGPAWRCLCAVCVYAGVGGWVGWRRGWRLRPPGPPWVRDPPPLSLPPYRVSQWLGGMKVILLKGSHSPAQATFRWSASLTAACLEGKLCSLLWGSAGFWGDGTLKTPTEHPLQERSQKMRLRIRCCTGKPDEACPFTTWCLATSLSVPTLKPAPPPPPETFRKMYTEIFSATYTPHSSACCRVRTQPGHLKDL